jgi:hypothetical protein
VSIGGVPVLRVGDHFQDGSKVESGAPHVFINGKAAARLGDPVTGDGKVKQGCSRVIIGNGGGGEYAFKSLREKLEPKATEKEKLLLCLPDIAREEARRAGNPEDRDGWLYLRRMFWKWFNGNANTNAKGNPDFFPIEWAWTQQFAWAVLAYNMFTSYGDGSAPENIYNQPALNRLGEVLREDKAKLDPVKEVTFDYTSLPPLDRIKYSFNYRTVPLNDIPFKNGLLAALGGYTLYALGRGRAKPTGRGGHTITLTGATVFVHDQFDFKPGDHFHWWSCENKRFEPSKEPDRAVESDWAEVSGADFFAFRDKYNLGNDFQVFSNPHEVEPFREVSYEYP